MITFNAARVLGPTYIWDMLRIRQSNYALRSADVIALEMPRMKYKSLGDRAFCAAASKEWNSLPPKSLREIEDITTFQKNLKTHYFALPIKTRLCKAQLNIVDCK